LLDAVPTKCKDLEFSLEFDITSFLMFSTTSGFQDWTSHKHDRTHMRRVSESSNEPRTSVKSRLQAEFLDKPKPKVNLDDQLKAVEDKLKQSERPRHNVSSLSGLIRANSLSGAQAESKIDQCLKKMKLLRSFKRHITMADLSDSEAFAKVEVTEMEDNGDYGTIYLVVPEQFSTSYAEYVITLDKRYEHGDTETIPEINIHCLREMHFLAADRIIITSIGHMNVKREEIIEMMII